MGYPGDPKAGNKSHVWFYWLKLYQALKRDWRELWFCGDIGFYDGVLRVLEGLNGF